MPYNDSLIFLFNKIYNNGDLLEIITSRQNLKSLNAYYKRNFNRHEHYDDFYNGLGDLSIELEKSRSAIAEFEKQFNRGLALQPAILSECFVSETLANALGLNNFLDADEKFENIPSQLFEALIRSRGGDLEQALPRYIYHNDRSTIVLLQYGDSSSIDAVFVKDGYRVRLEIKEEKAKLGEYDLNYNEDGLLLPTPNISENHPEYIRFIDIFNQETDIFSHMGSNFRIGDYLDDALLETIVERVFDTRRIDLYILQKGEKIFSVPTNYLLSCVDATRGSEIRTAGRNSYRVFTPNRLETIIYEQGGNIIDDIVTLPYDSENETRGRGMMTISRYKINSLFFVKYEDVEINDEVVSFPLNKIKQNKATISIHLYSLVDHEVLERANEEVNR